MAALSTATAPKAKRAISNPQQSSLSSCASWSPQDAGQIGDNMRELAQRKYTWHQIGKAYFDLLDRA